MRVWYILDNDLSHRKASPKWQVRRDCIDALITIASAPKLKNADFGELVKAMKKVRRYCALIDYV